MLKNVIAPIQAWLLSQGRCVACGRPLHKKGLLHREVHVWFYTPKKEIIFQLRGKNKDTFPNLLDATTGGHVELNSSFIDTALKEMLEESGIKGTAKDLQFISTIRGIAKDPATNTTNNYIREIYAYEYRGVISDLKTEEGDAQGFEAWPIEKLLGDLTDAERFRFIPSMFDKDHKEIYKKISKLLSS